MPLRSVEAATRDDAIAAAREQFGPSARVVGVRRVRSGGVLGFFATERYVAEVAADPSARTELAPAGGSMATASETTGGFASSPLSAAAAATAAPSSAGGTGRSVAPARNGAAAYAAAAGPVSRPAPREDDRVSELAGLFADAPADPQVGLYGPGAAARGPKARPAAPLAAPVVHGKRDAVSVRGGAAEPRPSTGRIGLAAALDPAAFSPDAPSPFTAALARMAAGDRDVRDAVEVALDQPRVVRGRSTAGSWPSRSGAQRLEDTSAPSGTTRQEEEPVGDQVVAPPSIHAPHAPELPNWAAEPAPITGSPREEAIAEVLRSALAQGHSDEALAGILRKVLAGASPQTALADPTEGSLFQAVVPVAPAPAPAAPAAMSLAMALANAGSAVPPVEESVPEPVVEVGMGEAPADPEPSMFESTTAVAPEAALDAAPATASDTAPPTEDASMDEPAADPEPAFPAPGHESTGRDGAAFASTGYESADRDLPAYEATPYEPPFYRVPSYRTPAYEAPLFDSPLFSRPTSDNTSMWGPSVASIWGEPTSSHVPLWGEAVSFGATSSYQADLPIWDDVLAGARSEEVDALPVDALPIDALPIDAPVADNVFGPSTEPAAAPEPVEVPTALEAEAPADEVAVEVCAAEEVTADEAAADDAAADDAAADEAAADDAAADEVTASGEDDVLESGLAEVEEVVLAPVFARTASDPAPLSLDATTVMPPLSLLPPLPGSRGGRGRPPVPPVAPRSSGRTTSFSVPRSSSPEPSLPAAGRERPVAAGPVAPAEDESRTERTEVESGDTLATVTRLHVTPPSDPAETPEIDLFEDLGTPAAPSAPAVPLAVEPEPEPQPRPSATAAAATTALAALGLPSTVLGADFERDMDRIGTYAALTRALGRLPAVPALPTGAGEVLFVVGPGVETLRAARTLAAGLRLDPESVLWATRGDLAGLAPRDSRMTTVDSARQRRQSAADAGTVTIVAVDVPLRTDPFWMAQMMDIWSPVAVWAVVEATRKAADLEPWLAGLTSVDALIVTDTDLSGEPAAALRRADTPVAVVDGARATAHRWASLLCERLETNRT